MPSRVYVHIGLPKTATTALQLDYFPYVNNKEYLFLGVLQPRAQQVPDPLFTQAVSAARSGKGVAEVKQALNERIAKEQRSLIISEEVLTVSSAEVSWQEQLANLSRILEGIDYRLMVTVREPVSAMFSFYVELYERFQKKGQSFSELALSDNDFRIYHYDSLLKTLLGLFDSRRIHIQTFENLVKADYKAVAEFLDYPAMESAFSVLNNHNQKKKSKSAVIISKRFRLRWATCVYRWLGGEQNKLASALKRIGQKPIQRLRGIKYQSVLVPMLSDDERHELNQKMSGTMDAMTERFGVGY